MRVDALLLCSLAASVSALISLPLKQHVPTAAEFAALDASTNTTVVGRESARLRIKRDGSVRSVRATNMIASYGVTVSVGEKTQHKYTLVVDTGASTLWVGAQVKRPYVKTSSSRRQKQQPFSERYASASMTGAYYKDTIRIGDARVANQGMGAATQTSGFGQEFDGVLGLGPTTLTNDVVPKVASLPTLVDSMFAQGKIPKRIVGVSFLPTVQTNGSALANGVISIGGVDPSRFVGPLSYFPHVNNVTSSAYFNIAMDSLTYRPAGKAVQSLTARPARRVGIVDTGTTLLFIPSDAFRLYKRAIPGAFTDGQGLLRVPSASIASLGNLTLTFGGKSFVLTPSAQLFPPAMGAQFTIGSAGVSIIADAGSVNTGYDFVLGQMFLERFYAAFDSSTMRVGFAATRYTFQRTFPAVPPKTRPIKAPDAKVGSVRHVSRRRPLGSRGL